MGTTRSTWITRSTWAKEVLLAAEPRRVPSWWRSSWQRQQLPAIYGLPEVYESECRRRKLNGVGMRRQFEEICIRPVAADHLNFMTSNIPPINVAHIQGPASSNRPPYCWHSIPVFA